MSAPFARSSKADWSAKPAEQPDSASSPARARQQLVEDYVAGQSSPAKNSHKRGALRPAQLVSTRARHEAAAMERLFCGVYIAMVLAVALLAARAVHPHLLATPVGSLIPLAVGAGLLIWSLRLTRVHGVQRSEALVSTLARIAASLLASALVAGVLIVLIRPPQQDVTAAEIWFALSATGMSLSQMVWWRRVNQWRASGRLTPNIVVVGATANARLMIEQARASGKLAILGVFDDRLGRSPSDVAGVPVLGDTQALLGHRIMPYVDRVVITVPPHAQGRVRELIERLKILPNEISLFLDVEGEVDPVAALSRIAGSPIARVSGFGPIESRVLAKRVQDLVFGALAVLVALPIMAVVALAVRLDSPGPVLFRQRRHGFNNEEIVVFKFRSMRHETADATASRQVSAGDDRVTRVGRIIRKFSLDELPQLFNVLAGEMSLVGPRPHAIGMKTGEVESAKLVAEYAWRHRMKPGVTGWAAVKGSRGPVDTPEDVRRRVELDVDYIERQSFWFDLYILAMTIPCLVFGDHETVR